MSPEADIWSAANSEDSKDALPQGSIGQAWHRQCRARRRRLQGRALHKGDGSSRTPLSVHTSCTGSPAAPSRLGGDLAQGRGVQIRDLDVGAPDGDVISVGAQRGHYRSAWIRLRETPRLGAYGNRLGA